MTLVNRSHGFGGATPDEQMESLLEACSGQSTRGVGGGHGLAELQDLAAHACGTIILRNGTATLMLLPDGDAVANTDEFGGLPTLGASVTLLLQLVPQPNGRTAGDPDVRRAFEAYLTGSLREYLAKRGSHGRVVL